MTTFLDFVVASGNTKLRKVRDARKFYESTDDYKLRDYYLSLKHGIDKCFEADGDKAALDDVLANVHDARKADNYIKCVNGLKKWIGRKDIEWVGTTRKVWTSGDLRVRVRPEVAVRVNGDVHLIKLHLKADPLSQKAADPLLRLMERTHGRQGTVGVLDARAGKLIVPTKDLDALDVLLDGEASSFVTMWRGLSS